MVRNVFQFEKMRLEDLWYLVGLIASDGCLSSDGRHIDITSADRDFLESIRQVLPGTRAAVTPKTRGYHIQLTSRPFYQFLHSIGLHPRKSLTLEKLKVPDTYFRDFLRGQIDGDGNIRRWTHPSNGVEQWALRIYTASQNYAFWLQDSIERILRVRGSIYQTRPKNQKHATQYVLKFGKLAAQQIFLECYQSCRMALPRKQSLAYACMKTANIWMRSKTVLARVSE